MEKETTQVALIKNDIKYIKDSMLRMENTFENYIKGAKREYSAKWVEKVVTFALSATGLIIIGAILGLIIAPKAFAIGQYISLTIN